MKIKYVLIVYMKKDGGICTLKNEFPATPENAQRAFEMANAIGLEYNKKGHDFAIFKETIEPVKYIMSEDMKAHICAQ